MQGDLKLIHTTGSNRVVIRFKDKEGNPKQNVLTQCKPESLLLSSALLV